MNIADFDFGLPETTTEQPPAFTDASSCKAWLAGLALTNLAASQTQLMRQLNLLNRHALRAEERLKIIGLLREPLEFIQEQAQKRFAGQALPFTGALQTTYDASQALWQELVTAYLQCLQVKHENAGKGAPHLVASTATTGAMSAMLAIHLAAGHANILTGPCFWRRLHAIFRAAEELKVAQLPVGNGHHPRTTASCYVEVLLLAAALPHELRSKQLSMVADWARRWSGKVGILQQVPADERTPSLAVDLGSDEAGAFGQPRASGDALRWLELSALRKSIKKRLVGLAQGVSPKALNLGTGCEQPACEALLKRIYQCWCKGGLKARETRTGPAQGLKSGCQLVSGFDAIHYHLTGQMNPRREGSIYLGYRQHQEIATFGRVTTHADDAEVESTGFALEDWRIVDQSATELRLERPLIPPGKPLLGDQLVAIRMHDQDGFMLGKICWIAMSASRDGLLAKVRLYPGRPEGIALHGSGSGAVQFGRGLFLPDVDQLGEAASMLTPPRWFADHPLTNVEVPDREAQQIRLDRLVERGADFERVRFEWL